MRKCYFHGRDKEGCPIMVVRMKNHYPGDPDEEFIFAIWLVEIGIKLAENYG